MPETLLYVCIAVTAVCALALLALYSQFKKLNETLTSKPTATEQVSLAPQIKNDNADVAAIVGALSVILSEENNTNGRRVKFVVRNIKKI